MCVASSNRTAWRVFKYIKKIRSKMCVLHAAHNDKRTRNNVLRQSRLREELMKKKQLVLAA